MNRSVDLLRMAREAGASGEGWRVLARPATTGGGGAYRPFTHAELEDEASGRTKALADAGAREGRVHPVPLEADEDGLLTLLALWRMGAVPAPLNPRLTRAEREEASESLRDREGHGAQVVLWTSGTSGRPRGVALSWEAMACHVGATRSRLGLDPGGDLWLASLSLAHVGGLMVVFRALLTGSRLVAGGTVGPEEIGALLGGDPPLTHLSLVPTQLLRLLDATADATPPATLRCVLLGGAHTPAPLLERALGAGYRVYLTYGMTEMCSQVATAPPDLVRRKPGTVGLPLEGVEVAVDGSGEILVRGATRALGYTDGAPLTRPDGWYPTGDLGRLDGEGHLWVTGRRTDRIVSGGVNVDAIEVEEALRRHPAVADACVVGIPDEGWGEIVAACVVPVAGEFDLDDVDGWLRDRLSGPKRPRLWRVAAALPVNANGKPDRLRVRELLLSM